MPEVSVDQIRERLQMFEARRKHYEWKSENTEGKLRRHEMWRHEYLADPYLTGAPDERVAERFKNIFMNVMELNQEGKLGPLMAFESDDGFMRKFTHMLEAYNGAIPTEIVQEARTPFAKYFENDGPIAKRMFDGYEKPTGPILVKYGRREFLEEMLQHGRMRIAHAKLYHNDDFLDSVKDDETSRYFFIPTYRERLKGEFGMEFQGHWIEYGNDDIAIPVVFPDYFVISLCDHIYYRMPTDFDADAALIIREPARFTQRVISQFLAQWPEWEPSAAPITYYDPYRDYSKIKAPEMCKHFGYSYQREFRIAFRSKQRIQTELEPRFISIDTMADYADLVTV
ncbi:hypothetical protein [Maricaulis maris]|uniref:hypothetical protein n=1 Tax=Maricaulis maris TaxID=74318 RepID=UPI003A92E7E4